MINQTERDFLLDKIVDIKRDIDNLINLSLYELDLEIRSIADEVDELYDEVYDLELEE